jgi:hypothetical protein
MLSSSFIWISGVDKVLAKYTLLLSLTSDMPCENLSPYMGKSFVVILNSFITILLDGVKVAQPCNKTDRIKTYFIIIFF